MTPTDPIATTPRTVAPTDVHVQDAERTKVRQLAEQFESMLLSQMLREMREAMAPDADSGGFGGPILADTMNTELGLALSRSGGVGLSKMLLEALARVTGPGKISEEDATQIIESVSPAIDPVVVAPKGAAGAVTSEFGWRVDPLNGQHRFHAGTDLRMAYGQDVRSATDGVVTFAGEQAGYGLTVVVDHGQGLETRYAHLSAAEVRPGEPVAAGQVIARSGNSGRTTGPHLHFEVRKDGQAVHPEEVAGLVGPA